MPRQCLISYGAAAVRLVFIDDEVALIVLVYAECLRLGEVLTDEKAHLLQRQIMLLAEGFKLLNGFGYAVCAAHQMFVDRTAVGAFFRRYPL